MDKNELSNRQVVYSFIVQYKIGHDGNSPTYREIMAATGLSSTSTVSYHLDQLEEARMIIRPIHSGNSRVIEIPGAVWIPPNRDIDLANFLKTGKVPEGIEA